MITEPTPIKGNYSGNGWHLFSKRVWVLWVAALLLATAIAVAAVIGFRDGEVAGPSLALVIAVAIALLPFGRPRTRVEPRMEEGADGAGLLLPTQAPRLIGILAPGLLGLLAIYAAIKGFIEKPSDILMVLIVGAIGIGLVLLARVRWQTRRRADRGILLTPEQIVLRPSGDSTAFHWRDVTNVQAHWVRQQQGSRLTAEEQVDNWLTFTLTPAAAAERDQDALATRIDAETLAADPHATYAVCRFYLDHPDRRPELGTLVAADRFRSLLRE